MDMRGVGLVLLLVGCAAAQTYKVCVSEYSPNLCQSLEIGGSQVSCKTVRTRVDCALQLARGEADVGYFSEEEVLLLAQQQPNDHRLVATVRDANRMEPFAFEAVAVVPNEHQGGVAGLRGGAYCHPGLDEADQRWSPRVLKELEVKAAQTDRCGAGVDPAGKSADGVEVETLAQFFSAGCRPGPWSSNETQDAALKSSYPSLCSLCGTESCSGYSLGMSVNVAGVSNDNRHVQALECLRQRRLAEPNAPAVAYVAWLHVRQYFTIRNPTEAGSFSLLCPDGSLRPLTTETLANATSPCAFVRQPWGGIVASTASASAVLTSLRSWWPEGASASGAQAWQTALFQVLGNGGGASARLVYETAPISPLNYTQPIRPVVSAESDSGCIPARRWCVLSAAELLKCSWLRAASSQLGLQPALACQQRATIFDCFRDIAEGRADLISSPSNYGYLARRHFKLSTVKMVQNQLAAQTRVVAFLKQSSATSNLTRFENLRGGRACFPEYGGLAYVSFVRAAQERGVVSDSECDYARALGDFFSGACAPGANDAQHKLSDSDYDAASLCSSCRAASWAAYNGTEPICTWDYSNLYFGNNGSLACLADPNSDIAVLNTANITAYLQALNMDPSSLRALCRNNSLAVSAGVAVDDNCALAHVVDAEVVSRRDDPLWTSLNVMLDALEQQFGTNAGGGAQLINLELFSPFDARSDLLFKDSTIGLTEASSESPHAAASNYFELFRHLDACSAAPAAVPAPASTATARALLSMLVASALAKIVFN